MNLTSQEIQDLSQVISGYIGEFDTGNYDPFFDRLQTLQDRMREAIRTVSYPTSEEHPNASKR